MAVLIAILSIIIICESVIIGEAHRRNQKLKGENVFLAQRLKKLEEDLGQNKINDQIKAQKTLQMIAKYNFGQNIN